MSPLEREPGVAKRFAKLIELGKSDTVRIDILEERYHKVPIVISQVEPQGWLQTV